MFPLLHEYIQYLTRKKVGVVFNDFGRNRPVSPILGCDRGTPIDRYYIEKFLGSRASLIEGKVLEIGSNTYSSRYGGKGSLIDVLHVAPGNKKATIVGDLTNPATLPENTFNCFICTQTFNFIFDVQKAVEGAYHLLRPGGVLLATVSGISQISRYDMERWGDYWRFTNASIEKLIKTVFKGDVEIGSFGNVLAATAFLQGIAVEDLPDQTLLDANDPDYQLLITIVARK